MMELRPRLLLLLLGIVLVNVPQIVTREDSCNETQYLNDKLKRCCNRCPPGYHQQKKCTRSSETVCQECESGSYTAHWNYANGCLSCYSCSQSLVEKQPCNATQARVCDCPDGYSCSMYDGLNECQFCEPPVSIEFDKGERPSEMKNIWIIIGVLLFMMSAIVVVICVKTRLVKRFGRMIKNKVSSESKPQPETGVAIAVVAEDNGDPASSLVEDLEYPVQVSDKSDVGVISLLDK